MTLTVHPAERTDLLADALADLLATPPEDPFAEEVVVVPAKGVERWLTQRLSHRLGVGPRGGDGVCAGVRFLNPRSLVALLTGTGSATTRGTPTGWSGRCSRSSTTSLDEPWCTTLAPHLGHGHDGDDGRAAPRPALLRRPPPRRPVRVVRRPAARAAHRLARGPRHRRRRGDARPRPRAGRPSCGGGCSTGVGVPAARRAARRDAGARSARAGRSRCPPAVDVRPHPAAGHRARAARARSARSARCTCGCRRPRRRLWDELAAASARVRCAARDDDVRPARRATRCSPRWAATPASCSAR